MMKSRRIRSLLLGAALGSIIAAPASAETLQEALAKAYASNPTLTGARADLRAADENVPISRASGLPSLRSTGGVNQSLYNTSNSSASGDRQATAGVDLSVPIFNGGSVRNSVLAAESRVEAGRSQLRSIESQLFTNVVAAYLDVIRFGAIVQLNQENVHVLQVNLQATRDRFEVGDLTRTDVAQSEARLALAQGQLRSAEAQLISARENYIRVVGDPPADLASPPPLPNLPDSAAQAAEVAVKENPQLEAAERARKAAGYDVQVARAGRLPQVSVGVGASYYNYLGSLGSNAPLVGLRNDGVSLTGGVSLSLPLFQGGRPAAQIRQAEARRSSAIEATTEAERAVVAQARSAYASWQSALRVIESSQKAVEANKLSLEGVRAENSVGTRTILDILNAEQELLNSQVTLVTARRDAYVAGFALLAAMGRAEAEDLGLDGGSLYDPVAHYNSVRGSISDWRTDPASKPIATGTENTPPQTPVVTRPLDPDLQRKVDTPR